MQGNVANSTVERANAMIESTLTARSQTTLPKAVRNALGLHGGDRIRYIISDDDVRILAVRPAERMFGAIAYDGPTVSLADMDRAIAEGAQRQER